MAPRLRDVDIPWRRIAPVTLPPSRVRPPRTIRLASAAPPRPVSTEYPRHSRGAAAIRLRGISTAAAAAAGRQRTRSAGGVEATPSQVRPRRGLARRGSRHPVHHLWAHGGVLLPQRQHRGRRGRGRQKRAVRGRVGGRVPSACADISLMNRGAAAAATWIFRGDVRSRPAVETFGRDRPRRRVTSGRDCPWRRGRSVETVETRTFGRDRLWRRSVETGRGDVRSRPFVETFGRDRLRRRGRSVETGA